MKLTENLSRNEFLKTAGGAIVGMSVLPALSPLLAKKNSKHEHHHHMGGKYNKLMEAGSHCIEQGLLCADHCIELLKNKDTSIAQCLETVEEMLPVCKTLVDLAGYNSKYLKKYAEVCILYCEECAKQCKKHAKKHKECKNCMDSCNACIKACKAIAA